MRQRLFYGWIVVAVAGLGLFFGGAPIVVYSFGVFLKPLSQEFHTGRGTISLAFTIHNFFGGLCAPLVGRLVDRYGARRVIVPGLLMVGLVLICALFIGSHVWQLYLFYLALAPIVITTTPIPYIAVIARWFDRKRGLALGLTMFGMGVGTVIVPPVVERLISSLGWRMAFAVAGCAMLAIPIGFIAALLKEDPREKGLAADGGGNTIGAIETGCPTGVTWPEVWRTRTFWQLGAAFALAGASFHACVLHMPALLSDRGLSAQTAALGSSIVGVAVIVGRLVSGYLQDLIFAPRVAWGIFGLSAAGIALLWGGSGGTVAMAAAFLVGLGMGAEVDIIGFLLSRYFGLRALGTTLGFVFGGFVVAGGLGGLLMGEGFDRTGSYGLPLAGFFAAMLVAVVLFAGLGPYRYSAAHTQTQHGEGVAA